MGQVTRIDHRLLPLMLAAALIASAAMCALPPDAVYGRPCSTDSECGPEHRCGQGGSCVFKGSLLVDGGEPGDTGALVDGGEPGDAGALVDGGEPGDAGELGDGGSLDGGEPPEDAGEPGDAGAVVLEVEPAYPGFSSWSDYVKSDGSGEACLGTEEGLWDGACLHAGVARRASLAPLGTCEGVVASDVLGAFTWRCEVRAGHAWVVSQDLRPGVRLLDLIAPLALAFRPNALRVEVSGEVFESEPALWWSDAFSSVLAAGILNQPKTIYVLGGVVSALGVEADHVSLVMPPGTRLSGVGLLLDVKKISFFWLEGEVVGTGATQTGPATRLDESTWGVLSGLRVRSASSGPALHVRQGTAVLVRDVQLEGGAGLLVEDGVAHTFRRLDVADATAGVTVRRASKLLADDLVISNVGDGTEEGDGLKLDQSSDNAFSRLLIVGTRDDAISLQGSSDNRFRAVTAVLHRASGVRLRLGSNANYFEGLALVNNLTGISVSDSVGNSFGDVAVLHNSTAVQITTAGSQTTFFGELRVGVLSPSHACASGAGVTAAAGGPFQQTGDQGCVLAAGQPATLTADVSAFGTFVENVANDAVNPTPGSTPGYNAIVDWTRFENRTRSFVRSRSLLASESRGRCGSSQGSCHFMDLGLLQASPSPQALLGVLPSPLDGVLMWEHTLESGESLLIARHLLELEGDGNGLCDPGERCLAMPHLGVYGGHGELERLGEVSLGNSPTPILRYAVPGY
jgi:hypothetical protein